MALSRLRGRLSRWLSSPSPSRRPSRPRLGVEALETREVPAVFSGIVNGQLLVKGDDLGNKITLDHVAGQTLVNGTGFLDSQITNGVLIQSGKGIDKVTVLRTVKPVTIDGQNGRDTVNISDARNIAAEVTVTNLASFSQLNVNDSSQAKHNVTMGIGADGFGFINGLALASIRYKANDVSAVRVNTGTGGNTFTVTDTVSNGALPATVIFGNNGADTFNVQKVTGRLTVNGGFGNDTINVGSAGNTLDGIQGPLVVDGGLAGNDTLNINDQGSATPHSYTITPTQVFRNGARTITFGNVENLKVNKGPVLGNPPQAKSLGLAKSVKAGQFAVLAGRLVDLDKGDVLRLVVDWGDGARQAILPGQKPFALKHLYAKAGAYTVRVIWTDSIGQSNSQDLKLIVTKA